MKKLVLELDVHDGKCKQKAMKIVSTVPEVASVSVDVKEKKLTLTGDMDPVLAVIKLRKVYRAEMITFGPEKATEKKKDETKKKEEPTKKEEPKNQAQVAQVNHPVKAIEVCPQYLCPTGYCWCVASAQEYPNYCVIL